MIYLNISHSFTVSAVTTPLPLETLTSVFHVVMHGEVS